MHLLRRLGRTDARGRAELAATGVGLGAAGAVLGSIIGRGSGLAIPALLLLMAAGLLIAAAAGVGLTLREWSRQGGSDVVVALRTAIRSGRLPDDADPTTWLPMLERAQEQTKSEQVFGPVRSLMWSVLLIGAALETHDAVLRAIWVAGIGLGVGYGVHSVWSARRTLPALGRLIEQCARRWDGVLRERVSGPV